MSRFITTGGDIPYGGMDQGYAYNPPMAPPSPGMMGGGGLDPQAAQKFAQGGYRGAMPEMSTQQIQAQWNQWLMQEMQRRKMRQQSLANYQNQAQTMSAMPPAQNQTMGMNPMMQMAIAMGYDPSNAYLYGLRPMLY